MDFGTISERGLVLLGCGKMGGAMLAGWLDGGLSPDAVHVIDPKPSDWLNAQGVHVNSGLPPAPAMTLLAVKPQMMGDALPQVAALSGKTVFLSIAAGTTIATLKAALGEGAAVIRAMPNTPAAVGRGITALIGNDRVTEADMALARATVGGAGALAEAAEESPSQLRVNVTSPNGTTQAALEVLMDEGSGFPALLRRAVAAAANRSRELGQ